VLIDIGKQAEYAFASEALKHGFVPFWPSTAMGAVDLVVCNQTKATRIQVKACNNRIANAYKVSAKMQENGKQRAYRQSDVDLMVVYLRERNLWYLIPIKQIKGQGLYLRPEDPRCPYAKYKEAWSLLA
jgi:hypothetical protein